MAPSAIGFAEAYVLSASREGAPPQRVRAWLAALTTGLDPHALASADLGTDGAEVLWSTAQHEGEEQGVIRLLVPRSGQHAFTDVVQAYRRDVTSTDRFAASIPPHRYGEPAVVMDPRRADHRTPVPPAGDPAPGTSAWPLRRRRRRRRGASAVSPARPGSRTGELPAWSVGRSSVRGPEVRGGQ